MGREEITRDKQTGTDRKRRHCQKKKIQVAGNKKKDKKNVRKGKGAVCSGMRKKGQRNNLEQEKNKKAIGMKRPQGKEKGMARRTRGKNP